MFKMKGVVPPMLTPFKENGDVDYESLKTLVEFLKKEVDGLFITGSYGAGPMMNMEERKRVTEICVETAGGEVPIIVMVGSTTTMDSAELTRHAKAAGADAVASVGPYYFTHNQNDLIGFYSSLIGASDLPVYLYNNPKFQGYEISLNTIKELKKRGLAGVKDATFDILTHATYQRVLVDESFDLALGTESMWLSACALGTKAFIPGLGNAFPEINRKMYKEGMAGDFEACRATQFQVNEMRDIMYLARSTQLAVYAMLEIRGIIKAYPRAPFIPATEEEKKSIKEALQKMGAI
ncbi:MAG: dihydrodipicolinate synthase family protein [Spirochaetota bacterium]|nr:dihydrodipicolinate synthase family protein [Spirochaetota bacterium]